MIELLAEIEMYSKDAKLLSEKRFITERYSVQKF